jgi:MOSC domain-containing protein YiiM
MDPAVPSSSRETENGKLERERCMTGERSMLPSEAPPAVEMVRGRVRSLHRKPETGSEHGLPKPRVPEFRIVRGGVAGDFNRYRHEVQHDEPNQAVLLMPVEMIRTLNVEGWPIDEGDVGENITTEGIPYRDFHPEDKFRVGEAVVEVTKPCVPCTNLYLLPYVGEAKGPGFLKTIHGRRGWYASVLQEGMVRTGDPIDRV